jgi:hypothetical protein
VPHLVRIFIASSTTGSIVDDHLQCALTGILAGTLAEVRHSPRSLLVRLI